MASFDSDARLNHPLDYRLAANGFVTLFWNADVLTEATTWLGSNGYRVVRVAASSWRHELDMHDDLASALDFPDYYGRNLDALNDCLSDVAAAEYGVGPSDSGLVLVLEGFDQFLRIDPTVAHQLLDTFAGQARGAALIGHRMLCLAQSDDPDLVVPAVGATPVNWNDAEWLDSNRQR